MENILKGLNAMKGVAGSFVCDEGGKVWVSALPSQFSAAMLSAVSRSAVQSVTGLRAASGEKVGDIDLLYANGRFIIVNQEEAYLCILSSPEVSAAALKQAANVAVGKLLEMMQEQKKRIAPALEEIVSSYPDLVGAVNDFSKSAEGRSTLTSLGKQTGKRIFQKQYADKTVVPNAWEGLKSVAHPAVSSFSIARAEKDKLIVVGCPFCQGVQSSEPHCDFLAGFITGLLDEIPGLAGTEVMETQCKAKGDDACTFVVVGKVG